MITMEDPSQWFGIVISVLLVLALPFIDYKIMKRKPSIKLVVFSVCFSAALILLILHIFKLPYGVYVAFSRIYEILISNIGLTAVIAAAGLGLNAVRSNNSEKSKQLIFDSCSIAIVLVVFLGACSYSGVVSFTSFGEDYIYRGQTFNGKADGFGTVYDRQTEDIVYRGNLKNNQYDGKGTLFRKRQYSDGSEKYELLYIGEFKSNQYNGHGIAFRFSGDHNYICYIGEFKDGFYSGHGKWYNYYENYEGDEVDLSDVGIDMRDQIDTSHLFLRYDGYFANQMYNSSGTEHDIRDGNRYLYYIGDFVDSKHEGSGTLYFPEGPIKYVGGFLNDQYHGEGTEYILNETGTDHIKWYHGNFAYGLYEGDGTIFDSSGSPVKDGQFHNGEFVSEEYDTDIDE